MTTTRRLVPAWMAALLASAAVLAGCGSSTATTGPPPTRATSVGHCPKTVLKRALRRIPASFHPVLAIECSEDEVAVRGKGQWLAEDVRRATHGLDRLVRALRRPDQPVPRKIACAAVGIEVPEFVLVGAGVVIRPKVPTDECGEPQTAVLSALRSLPWKLAHRVLLRQVESPAESASGCPPAYEDLFDLDAANFVPAKTAPPSPGEQGPLTVCAYRDTDAALNHPDGNDVSGADMEIGAFTGWTRQRGRAAASLLIGLSGGRTTPTCETTHPGFATVSGPGVDLLVELGGWDRVLRTEIKPAPYPAHEASDTSSTTATAGTEVEEIGQATPAAVARIRSLTSLAQ